LEKKASKPAYKNVDEYISDQPPEVQKILNKVRKIIRKEATGAEEFMSYGLPSYRLHRMLVYFGAFKNHYSLVALPSGIKHFSAQLKKYKCSKSTIQFPYDEPIPAELIASIVQFRVKENKETETGKKSKTAAVRKKVKQPK
jgi:uncharacterized protein YdhG (YjbR/CyaY superfamily)